MRKRRHFPEPAAGSGVSLGTVDGSKSQSSRHYFAITAVKGEREGEGGKSKSHV